jgi:anti-sigma factor RsiW
MTTQDSPMTEHERMAELLPWYAGDTLEPKEKAAVARHLSICPVCREALEQHRALAVAFESRPDPLWQPTAAKFQSLLDQVDALEAGAAAPQPKPGSAEPSRPNWLARLGGWLRSAPTAPRWAFAAETLAFAALALALAIPQLAPRRGGPGPFETLTDGTEHSAAAGPRLHVVFAEDLTEGEMRGLLRAIGGRVVDGPSAVGAYTVALAADRDIRNAAKTLRDHGKVRLAEPVPGQGGG